MKFVSFKSFTDKVRAKVLNDPDVMNNLFEGSQDLSPEEKTYQLDTLIGEARETLNMIAPYLDKYKTFLEIGGGIGLIYGYLSHQDYRITSIEPSMRGFGNRFKAGQKILETMDIDLSHWLNLMAADLNPNIHKSDLIFSNMVLEHIPNLEESMKRLGQCLTDTGEMVHRCPNYTVPFEPHYNILLIPGFPRWTEYCKPSLKKESLWKDLHFTTVGEMKRLACQLGLKIQFQKGMYQWVFNRLLQDPIFRQRKKLFYKIINCVRFMKLLPVVELILKNVPLHYVTPMTFCLKKKS